MPWIKINTFQINTFLQEAYEKYKVTKKKPVRRSVYTDPPKKRCASNKSSRNIFAELKSTSFPFFSPYTLDPTVRANKQSKVNTQPHAD